MTSLSCTCTHVVFQVGLCVCACVCVCVCVLRLGISECTAKPSFQRGVQNPSLLLQVKRRIENEQYMRRHPEISVLVSSFVR